MILFKRYLALRSYIHLLWPLAALALLWGLLVFLVTSDLLTIIPPQDLATMPEDLKQRYLQSAQASQITAPLYILVLSAVLIGGAVSYGIVAKRLFSRIKNHRAQ